MKGFSGTFWDRHIKGPRLSLFSEHAPKEAKRVRMLADKSVGQAHAAYQEEFGVPVNDQSIDHELADALGNAFRKGSGVVELPIHVALAFWLREGQANDEKPVHGPAGAPRAAA
jgi:hypothetical protein